MGDCEFRDSNNMMLGVMYKWCKTNTSMRWQRNCMKKEGKNEKLSIRRNGLKRKRAFHEGLFIHFSLRDMYLFSSGNYAGGQKMKLC